MSNYSMNTTIEVWDDTHGSKIVICPDDDIGELVEIRYYTEKGLIGDRITMHPHTSRYGC
jgi:hypothetical protein